MTVKNINENCEDTCDKLREAREVCRMGESDKLITRFLNVIISIFCAIGLSIGSWAMKQAYESQILTKELAIRVQSLERITTDNRSSNIRIDDRARSAELEVNGIKTSLDTIKEDIKEIKQILKEEKK